MSKRWHQQFMLAHKLLLLTFMPTCCSLLGKTPNLSTICSNDKKGIDTSRLSFDPVQNRNLINVFNLGIRGTKLNEVKKPDLMAVAPDWKPFLLNVASDRDPVVFIQVILGGVSFCP
jgi:hypothetical protein